MERFIGIGLALAVLGGIAMYYGASQLWQAAESSPTPREVTMAELIAHGPQGNRHVRIRDYKVGGTFVEVKKEGDVLGDAYLPIFPSEGSGVAVLELNSMSAKFFSGKEPVEGMVTRKSVDSETASQLASQYPGPNFDAALVIDWGAKPPPVSSGWSFVGLGILLMLPLVGTFLYAWLHDRRQRRASALVNLAWQSPAGGPAEARNPLNVPAALEMSRLIQEALAFEEKGDWQQALDRYGQIVRQADNPQLVEVARARIQQLEAKQAPDGPKGTP
jgi:hypothetical protein